MKKVKFSIESSSRIAHNFRVVVNRYLRNYYVLVEHDSEEVGTWQCYVFSRDFLGYGRVEVMDFLFTERIYRSPKASSVSVARQSLRHYLYSSLDDYLPF